MTPTPPDHPARDELAETEARARARREALQAAAEAAAEEELDAEDLDSEDGEDDDFVDSELDGEAEDHGAGAPAGGKSRSKKAASAISGKYYRKRQLVRIDSLRPSLAERIQRDFPDLPHNAKIAYGELARYQMLYVEELLQQEHGEFSELDRQVAESIANQDTIAENTEEEYIEHRSLGEKLSDGLASFGGSWAFLISFFAMLMIWMGYNVLRGDPAAFDPYPFILLNLVLSCLAAIQAPVIMMSQKRQEEKDRQRSFNDYRVNLKAELEIRHLHEKIDYLISKQWQRMSEIQQVQLEIMHQGARHKKVKLPRPADDGAASETANAPEAAAN